MEQLTFDLSMPLNIFEFVEEKISCEGFQPMYPARPTLFQPGTPEKIEQFRKRAESCEELFHADDPQLQMDATEYERLTGKVIE